MEGGNSPIYTLGAAVLGLERRRDMCVNPKGPERVVEIEHQQFWHREPVSESFRWLKGRVRSRLRDSRRGRRLLGFCHLRGEEIEGWRGIRTINQEMTANNNREVQCEEDAVRKLRPSFTHVVIFAWLYG